MITENTTLVDISQEKTLRIDVDYIKFHQTHTDSYLSFDELFYIAPAKPFKNDDLNKNFYYCEIGNSDKNGDILPVILNFENMMLEDQDYYKKIEKGDITSVDLNDILLSKIRPNLKKIVRITDDKKDVYFTTAFIRLKAKEMPNVLYYCLRTIFHKDLIAIARQGKGYPTINEKDLITLRFNKLIISKLRSNYVNINKNIIDIEKQVANKVTTLIPVQEIIDTIFQREFNFDYDKFEKLKSNRCYYSQHALFSNNQDLRFSAKFHRPAGDFVMKQLAGITNKKIKHYLSEPITLGASISPKDYDDSGEYNYISMATIKTWEIDESATLTVSDSYSVSKIAKSLQKNDILMARSGEGTIGKVAIITNENLKGIFADFTMRICLDSTCYNPKFAYYYFRSRYFQYLIEIYKKGLGNNTNIFPIVIQEFPIPDISLLEQQRIVEEIQAKIKTHDNIKTEITSLRSQIDDIIIQSISS